MTTQSFARPTDPVPAPKPPGGGIVGLNPPLVVPVPPPRSVWGIVFPIALIVGVVGFVILLYASGMRSIAMGGGMFGAFMLFGIIGMAMRRGGVKMTWGQLTQGRRQYFADLDDVRERMDRDRRAQYEQRAFHHPSPSRLAEVAGSARMWERQPGDAEFAVVRLGLGRVRFGKDPAQLNIATSTDLEPATGHALQKFLLHQFHIDDTPKTVWLQRFPGMAIIGEREAVRGLARAMICQLAVAHSPADVQVIVVSDSPGEWGWCKWLPHAQHSAARDGCGERRLIFGTPAELDDFLGANEQLREAWTPPPLNPGLSPSPPAVLPLRIVVDDSNAPMQDWEALTGGGGYAGMFFLRLAESQPRTRPSTGARHWVGFDPLCTYRLDGQTLRKRLPEELSVAGHSDELDAVFAAQADTMTVFEAQRVARGLAPWRTGLQTQVHRDESARTVLDAVGAPDPEVTDFNRQWSGRRVQGRDWMRFPIGVADGQTVYMDLKEGAQGGYACHGVMIGNTGAGKSEGILSMVTALAMTHSPDVANVVFIDFKMKSIAGLLSRIPHVVAAVSNLRAEMHLVGRMYEALEGELDIRAKLCNDLGDDVIDLGVYNERRLSNPSLKPIPALWIIVDEYQELLGHPVWGPKFKQLFWRIMRLGRAYHMFVLLVGQTYDTQKLVDYDKILGFRMACRTGTEQESVAAIGVRAAAHIHEYDEQGVAYLRVGLREARKFRFFFSRAPFHPPVQAGELPVAAGTWFEPREFTALPADDVDGCLAAPAAVEPVEVDESGELLVDVVTTALQGTGAVPPTLLWLPPLGVPPSVDELVSRYRGRPWSDGYGDTEGLVFPVALEDRPREHTQSVFYLDVLGTNAQVVAAPQMGATTALSTMIVAGALLYSPEMVQFYVIAASGPQLSAVEGLPHVAAVIGIHDLEGVNRLLATVSRIVAERERLFALHGLDIETLRATRFDGVEGGDVVVVVDGWVNFAEATGDAGVETVMGLMRARNYGVRVIFSSTDYTSRIRTGMRSEVGQKLELRLVDPTTSAVPRIDGAIRAAEVPQTPGRGLSPSGHHIIVGTGARGLVTAIAQMFGDAKAATVGRLPESVTYEQMHEQVVPSGEVPFGISEWDLQPIGVDFRAHPHVVAVGLAQSGRTNWLRTMLRSIMDSYTPDEAEIIIFDQRRKLVGVVPDDWPMRYNYTVDDMRLTVEGNATLGIPGLLDVFAQRKPPPGADLLRSRHWEGREIFLVVDDITSWRSADSPLAKLAPFVQQADHLGFHIVATADTRRWPLESATSGVVGKIAESLSPTFVMSGHQQYGRIVGDLKSRPERPGKGTLWTSAGAVGVLTAWSEPPRLEP